jgi:hypothetical protein
MHLLASILASVLGGTMTPKAATNLCCGVVELRQYRLHPGKRETLIDLFERHLLDPQEAAGMTIVGQFRDRKREDRFVWVRGFPDMERRQAALERFYDGPIWASHRNAANATMIDSDDVLLLKPARPDLAFHLDGGPPPASGTEENLVVVGIYSLTEPPSPALVARFEEQVAPMLAGRGLRVNGLFVTESAPNRFRLPVREGENVLVWFALRETTRGEGGEEIGRLADASVLDGVKPDLLELSPTSSSRLGGGQAAPRPADFTALTGAWKIHNRFLKGRLRRSQEWIEFEAESRVEPLLDGLGQIDRYTGVLEGRRIHGVTLRLLDPATGEWTLYWADSVRPGKLLPPMVGRFSGGSGEFFGDEEVDGRSVLCRFRWNGLGTDAPQWEQAFSGDGGSTWETNWIMTFTRKNAEGAAFRPEDRPW